MARSSSIKFRTRRKKKNQSDVDITSLLDILTILMVFLLQSYNSSGIIINVPKEITLPNSISQTVNNYGVNIQISKDQIWVDDKEIVNTATDTGTKIFDRSGRKILPLFDELVRVKETIKQAEKLSPQANKFSGIANLVIDKSLKYNYLKKVMYTCAEAGYKEFKFVVLSSNM